MDSHELTDAVGHIYEAAVDPNHWPDTLRATIHFVGGERGIIGITDSTTGKLDISHRFELDHELMERWVREYDNEDPWADGLATTVEGQVGRGIELVPLSVLKQNRTYREICVPVGAFDTCWTILAANRLRAGFLSVFQGEHRGPFPIESEERLTLLSPHLVRATRIHTQLAELRARSEALESALDKLSFGLITCTADARIVTLNRCAELLFTNRGPLRLFNGELSCQNPEQTGRLRELITLASATAAGDSARGGGVVALRRSEPHEGPLTITIVPLSRHSTSALKTNSRGQATALLTVTEPGQPLKIPHGALNEIFGLTRAEAQLALGLSDGLSLADYANQAGISPGTARWTLKNVQSKTGVGRQAELVSLIHRSLAPLVED